MTRAAAVLAAAVVVVVAVGYRGQMLAEQHRNLGDDW